MLALGTLVKGEDDPVQAIPKLLAEGFECFEITFWRNLGSVDLEDLAKRLFDAAPGVRISALGVYGNPLTDAQTAADLAKAVRAARAFGCGLVCGFTGRVPDVPIPESLPRFVQVFGELVKLAADEGIKIGFENCAMGGGWNTGDWNLAHGPKAWELLFSSVDHAVLGLEWEPCHQLLAGRDPLPQLDEWTSRIWHVHGKDANGLGRKAVQRTVGFGDSDWHEIINKLVAHGYEGTIDVEGWHDPVYCDEREMEGQKGGLAYLRTCRDELMKNSL